MSTDPRFLPQSAQIYYETDSQVEDIDRLYGTVSQKIDYPKFANFIAPVECYTPHVFARAPKKIAVRSGREFYMPKYDYLQDAVYDPLIR
jgi:hypothetical protein